jgi:hypothetical protein
MRWSARWGTLTAALVLATSSAAHAADDRATREAEARFTEGLARVKVKDFEAARLSFEQAYAVLHRPLILWNLALSEEKTGHALDALVHFRQVTREAVSESDRTSAQKHVDALMAELSRIDVQAPPGTTFAVDGTALSGVAPLADPIDVTAGHHALEAHMAAGVSKTSDVDALAGQVVHVTFAADAPVPVAASAPAPSVAASATASTQAPEPASPDVATAANPFWTPRTVTAATLAGAGVVAAGFGILFAVESNNNKKTVEGFKTAHPSQSYCSGSDAPVCVTWKDAVNAQNRDAHISDAIYFAAAAFGVGAVVSWFFWPKHGPAKSAWLAPAIGPGTAGVGAGGSF